MYARWRNTYDTIKLKDLGKNIIFGIKIKILRGLSMSQYQLDSKKKNP